MTSAFSFVVFLFFAVISTVSTTTYSCNANLTCGCSKPSTVVTTRIVGGEIAANHAWGWMVSLRLRDEHICGATLLSLEYAVTAGHCISNYIKRLSALSIYVDSNYLNNTPGSTAQKRTVTNAVIHPDYDEVELTSDIAIIKFSPLIMSVNSSLAFICLPAINDDPFDIGSNLVAAGWGHTAENGVLSNVLRQVTLQVYSSTSQTCKNSIITDPTIQFCAGNSAGGKDTCQGDSGGPLMAFVNDRWVLAGITSYGLGCANRNLLGIYTRVSVFIPFISSNTGIVASTTSTILNSNSTNRPTDSSLGGNQGNIVRLHLFIFLFSILVLV